MHRLLLFPALLAVLSLAACSGASTTSPSGPVASAAAQSAAAASAPAASAPGAESPAAASASTGGGAAGCAVAPSGSTATVSATIKNFAYSPTPIEAKVGDVIGWANQDSTAHTVTMDNGACDTKQIAAGSTAMLVFSAAGTYTYHCAIHPQMKATIDVK
jgi:plastocyanin